jgi:hypothetical protein
VPPIKDDLLHVRFGNTEIHMVNTPNIQARGLHIPQKGANRPTVMTGQDIAWQQALLPRLMAAGHRMVQGAG